MLPYDPKLKSTARRLRSNLTDSESVLWSRVRGKQLMGIQFYRQKPIGSDVADFFAPSAQLVVEVDGSQHMQNEHVQSDQQRDQSLAELGLKVLRFNSRQVLTETEAVVEVILQTMKEQLNTQIPKSPPTPLLQRGEK
jgi:very-short-patch-repair endonuclease